MVGASQRLPKPDEAALSSLSASVGKGDVSKVETLLKSRSEAEISALISTIESSGTSLLQHACLKGQAGCLSMFLEKGANPSWSNSKGNSLLHSACHAGQYQCALRLLRAGASVNKENGNGSTPLLIAAFGGHVDLVKLLLEYGADPDVRDKLGREPGVRIYGAKTGAAGKEEASASQELSEIRGLLRAARGHHLGQKASARAASPLDGNLNVDVKGDAAAGTSRLPVSPLEKRAGGSTKLALGNDALPPGGGAGQSNAEAFVSISEPYSPVRETPLYPSMQMVTPSPMATARPSALASALAPASVNVEVSPEIARRSTRDVSMRAALTADMPVMESDAYGNRDDGAIQRSRGRADHNVGWDRDKDGRSHAPGRACDGYDDLDGHAPHEEQAAAAGVRRSRVPLGWLYEAGYYEEALHAGRHCATRSRGGVAQTQRMLELLEAQSKRIEDMETEMRAVRRDTRHRNVACEISSRGHSRRSDRAATARGFSPIAGELFAMDDEGRTSVSPSRSPRRGDDGTDVGGGERVSRTAGRKRQRAREHEGAAAAVPLPSCSTRSNARSSPSRRCDERKRQRAPLPRAPHAPSAIPLTPELTRARSSPTSSLSPRSRSRRNRATAAARDTGRDRRRCGAGEIGEDSASGDASGTVEVKRLRAVAAALNRELLERKASSESERARQGGVQQLDRSESTGGNEVCRLSRQLREAERRFQAQAQETEELRRCSEEQKRLLDSRAKDLRSALERLETLDQAVRGREIGENASARGDGQDASGPISPDQGSGSSPSPCQSLPSSLPASLAAGPTEPGMGAATPVPRVTTSGGDDAGSAAGSAGDGGDGAAVGTFSCTASPSGTSRRSCSSSSTMALEHRHDGPEGSRVRGEAQANARAEEGETRDGNGDGDRGVFSEEEARAIAGARGRGAEETAPDPPRQGPLIRGDLRDADLCGGDGRRHIVVFSPRQVHAACQGFPETSIIGRGGFGPVFRGRIGNEDIAVKRLDGFGHQGLSNFLKEVTVLSMCWHSYLVPLWGICMEPNLMLVYPFVGKSLDWHLGEPERRASIPWHVRVSAALSIAKALEYLHQPREGQSGKPTIIHCDVKSQNILLDSDLQARLCDVGVSEQREASARSAGNRAIGTIGYIDPEYQETGIPTPSSDVFSLGMVFLELITGFPAYAFDLEPRFIVERVAGKQLSECLDSALPWNVSYISMLDAFASDAWQCVKDRGSERPRLANLIERLGQALAGLSTTGVAGNGDDWDACDGNLTGGDPRGAGDEAPQGLESTLFRETDQIGIPPPPVTSAVPTAVSTAVPTAVPTTALSPPMDPVSLAFPRTESREQQEQQGQQQIREDNGVSSISRSTRIGDSHTVTEEALHAAPSQPPISPARVSGPGSGLGSGSGSALGSGSGSAESSLERTTSAILSPRQTSAEHGIERCTNLSSSSRSSTASDAGEQALLPEGSESPPVALSAGSALLPLPLQQLDEEHVNVSSASGGGTSSSHTVPAEASQEAAMPRTDNVGSPSSPPLASLGDSVGHDLVAPFAYLPSPASVARSSIAAAAEAAAVAAARAMAVATHAAALATEVARTAAQVERPSRDASASSALPTTLPQREATPSSSTAEVVMPAQATAAAPSTGAPSAVEHLEEPQPTVSLTSEAEHAERAPQASASMSEDAPPATGTQERFLDAPSVASLPPPESSQNGVAVAVAVAESLASRTTQVTAGLPAVVLAPEDEVREMDAGEGGDGAESMMPTASREASPSRVADSPSSPTGRETMPSPAATVAPNDVHPASDPGEESTPGSSVVSLALPDQEAESAASPTRSRSSPAAEAPRSAPPRGTRECMMCAAAPIETRFLPCMHSIACRSCASLLRTRGDRCPVDRSPIGDFETGQFQLTYTGD